MPWDDTTVKTRLGILRQAVQNFGTENAGKYSYEQNIALGVLFSLLRELWEDGVEQVLFSGAITRYDPAIHTVPLKRVHGILKSEVEEVDRGMTLCSERMIGHSTPAAAGGTPPDLIEIIQEVAKFAAWRDGVIARQSNG